MCLINKQIPLISLILTLPILAFSNNDSQINLPLTVPGEVFHFQADLCFLHLNYTQWPESGPLLINPETKNLTYDKKDEKDRVGLEKKIKFNLMEWFEISPQLIKIENKGPEIIRLTRPEIYSNGKKLYIKEGGAITLPKRDPFVIKGKGPWDIPIRRIERQFNFTEGDQWTKIDDLPDKIPVALHYKDKLRTPNKGDLLLKRKKQSLYSLAIPDDGTKPYSLVIPDHKGYSTSYRRIKYEDIIEDKPCNITIGLSPFNLILELPENGLGKIDDIIILDNNDKQYRTRAERESNGKWHAEFDELEWKNQPFTLKDSDELHFDEFSVTYKNDHEKGTEIKKNVNCFRYWKKLFIDVKGVSAECVIEIKPSERPEKKVAIDPPKARWIPSPVSSAIEFKGILDPEFCTIRIQSSQNKELLWSSGNNGKNWFQREGVRIEQAAPNIFSAKISILAKR
jgi:hypothetical protein